MYIWELLLLLSLSSTYISICIDITYITVFSMIFLPIALLWRHNIYLVGCKQLQNASNAPSKGRKIIWVRYLLVLVAAWNEIKALSWLDSNTLDHAYDGSTPLLFHHGDWDNAQIMGFQALCITMVTRLYNHSKLWDSKYLSRYGTCDW